MACGTSSFLLYRKIRFCRNGKKEEEFTEHMPDKLLRHLHLRNNPYREVHPRSYGECPGMTFLPVDNPRNKFQNRESFFHKKSGMESIMQD